MSPRIVLFALVSSALLAGCATSSTADSARSQGRPYQERPSYEASASRVLPETAKVYTLDDVSPKPRAVGRSAPRYPFELRRAGVQGEAVIKFIVSEDGTVANARIDRASHPAFGEAALACVQSWRFAPAMRNGRPVNVEMQVPIEFTIN